VIDQPAVSFAVKPTLTGTNVLLRPLDIEKDATALREMLTDPEALKLTGSYHAPGEIPEWDETAERNFRDWYGTRNEQPDRLDLAVVDRTSGQCVGEVVLNEWNEPNRSCNFRTIIGPRGRDRGLGTEAIRLLLGYGFERLGLHRIALDVINFNPRAKRVYEKLGFVTEGVLRAEHRWDSQWIDVTIMSMLARDWDRHRARPQEQTAGMPISVRPARAGDVTALVRLRLANAQRHVELDPASHRVPDAQAVHQHFASRLDYAAGEQPLVQVAELDGDVVGMVEIVIAPDYPEFQIAVPRRRAEIHTVVLDGYRGQGIEKALVAAGEQLAAGLRISLLTAPILASNAGAIAFYADAGFSERGVLLGKELDAPS
jgi:RimJ/RimL family protein N-acetyltransferase